MDKKIDIKAFREAIGLTQAELGKEVGVDQSTVSNWERGTAPRGSARKMLEVLIANPPKKTPEAAPEAAQ